MRVSDNVLRGILAQKAERIERWGDWLDAAPGRRRFHLTFTCAGCDGQFGDDEPVDSVGEHLLHVRPCDPKDSPSPLMLARFEETRR